MAESLTISEKPFEVIFTEMFLPLTILSMNRFCSNSSRCFDAACCDFLIFFPSDEVVIVT